MKLTLLPCDQSTGEYDLVRLRITTDIVQWGNMPMYQPIEALAAVSNEACEKEALRASQ